MFGPHVRLECPRSTPTRSFAKMVYWALHAYMCMDIFAAASGSKRVINRVREISVQLICIYIYIYISADLFQRESVLAYIAIDQYLAILRFSRHQIIAIPCNLPSCRLHLALALAIHIYELATS